MAMAQVGTVKWFNEKKGFGFVIGDDGIERFLHYKNISMDGFKTLKEGQKVEFTSFKGQKGMEAHDVRVVGNA